VNATGRPRLEVVGAAVGLEVVEDDLPGRRPVAVHEVDRHAGVRDRSPGRMERLPLPRQEVLGRDAAVDVALDQREQVALHDLVRVRRAHEAGAGGEGVAPAVVEVAVPHAVQRDRLAVLLRAVVQVERLPGVGRGAAVHVAVGSADPQVVVDRVRVGDREPHEVHRRDARHQLDVAQLVVHGREHAVEDAVVGDHHASPPRLWPIHVMRSASTWPFSTPPPMVARLLRNASVFDSVVVPRSTHRDRCCSRGS
jgi:hypothetical protein